MCTTVLKTNLVCPSFPFNTQVWSEGQISVISGLLVVGWHSLWVYYLWERTYWLEFRVECSDEVLSLVEQGLAMMVWVVAVTNAECHWCLMIGLWIAVVRVGEGFPNRSAI
jgi:hypothetical protein